MEIQYTKLFINNQFVDSKSGKRYDNYNPYTGKVLCQIADADQYDVDYAVDCAKRAFYRTSQWRKFDGYERGRLLYKLADLMEEHFDKLINLEVIDHGKIRVHAKYDIEFAIRTIRYYAGYADKYYGSMIPLDDKYMSATRVEAYGVVGLLLSSHNPILSLVYKFAPALATGNCVVIKPAHQTPLTALYIAYLTKLVGFPDGVFNVVLGRGHDVGRWIVNHMDIQKIVFSGQTKNGKDVMENAARNYLKPVAMDLSSNNPLIVFKDFDLDQAVRIAHDNLFYNQGQNKASAHRIYVQEDIYDEFVKRSVELVRQRKVGNPLEHDVLTGPIVDEIRMNRLLTFIENTKKEGAKLEYGGKRYGTQGYFIEPTVFSNCMDNMRCAVEDLYGPIQYIFKFKTHEELYERLNKNYYGLSVGVLTNNVDYFYNYAYNLEYGNVWFNDYQIVRPQITVGVYKMSGWGYNLGKEGLYEYLRKKTVTYRNTYLYNRDHDYEYKRF